MRKKNRLTILLLLLPFLIGLCVFYVFPYLYGWYMSLRPTAWVALLQNAVFRMAVRNTVLFWCVGIPLMVLLSIGVALLLYENRHRHFFLCLIAVPLCIPGIYIGGVVSGLYERFSINENSGWSFVLIVVIYIWKYCGFNIIVLCSAFSAFPREIEEAAQIDGCKRSRFVWQILLPSVYPELSFVFLLSLLNSFSIYRELYAIYGMYPPKCVYLIFHFITNNFSKLGFDVVAVASCMVSASLLIPILYFLRRERRFL